MALVVEQTLPYSASALHLEDPKRWSRLFDLIRPSVTVVELSSGEPVVIDTALINSNDVAIAVVGRQGHLSNRVLSHSFAAFTVAQDQELAVRSGEIVELLHESGFNTECGVIVVRTGAKQNLRHVSEQTLEVTLPGELKLDHVLSLLLSSNRETKASLAKTKAMLEQFVKAAVETTSTFQETKDGDRPSVAHAVGVAKFTSAKAAINRDLEHLLGSKQLSGEYAVYSVHFSDLNGFSKLENNILAHEISVCLSNKNLPSHITQSTIRSSKSLTRGWGISLCAIPTSFLSPQARPSNTLANSIAAVHLHSHAGPSSSKFLVSDALVRKMINAGCDSVIKDEPAITEYDTIVGDGDCGYTLRDGAKQVLHFISDADLSKLPSALSELVDDLEVNMGGTSGALYCIFLSSLAQNMSTASSFPEALKGALDHLLKYTRARLGDRTVLDCLIPFTETLLRTGNAKKALDEAVKGVESTKKLEAKMGRSSYLDEAATRGVPDPGAYGLLKLLEGMVGVLD
ncbi:hypothetical protein OIDMADRAFT_140806 [Oidiodendron maius Zn]|uniref:DhaL domain-containing protein n=1 Tax=Oidiodendron maius (strain Zn) TaxID=913774 RepID=A0A0C3E262_OIDMZ|nr:hypothetical protein OIDMADRAFT_140806 [Oidiodendron maius Zn]